MSTTHQAAALTTIGQPLSIVQRTTPTPKPGEILIQVQAIAMNPVDYYQRDFGMPPVAILPAVSGEDVSGIVLQSNHPDGPKTGTRVLALASSFYHRGDPDYGAFQERVVVRHESVIPIPDHLSFEEACIMPLAVLTALSAYTTLDIPLATRFNSVANADDNKKQAILIWGASSSVGTFAVQSARSMGFVVYATAGAHNLAYVKELGAAAVFDHRAVDVVDLIVQRTQQDGSDLRTAHVVVEGGLKQTLDVLARTKGSLSAKIAHAPLLPPGAPSSEGVEVKFTYPPTDEKERNEHMKECFHGWLKDGLEKKTVVPSPRVQIVEGGLRGVDEALNALKKGVSATKIVVKLD